MAARDRYTIEITCPKCRKNGVAKVSEDDHSYMKDPGFAVDELPDGFRVTTASHWRKDTRLACECGEIFVP